MIKDRYDGITVGTFATERWLEKNAVLSRLLGKGYVLSLRLDLDNTVPDLKKVENSPEGDDTSNIYEIIAAPFNKLGGVDVNKQDQHTEVIDLFLSLFVQDITIAVNTSLDDSVVTITSAAEPINGHVVCFKESTAFYQGIILSHIANGSDWDITLDSPLDFPYTTDGGCSETDVELAGKVGTIAAPIVFDISPASLVAGTKWDLTRVLMNLTATTAMDDGKFGGIPALTNGIVIRVKNGITKNIFNAKTNGDFALRAYDVNYVDKAPAGENGVRIRRSFNGDDKNGVTLRLDSESLDEFQIIIQDSLVGLTSFKIVAQGHVVD